MNGSTGRRFVLGSNPLVLAVLVLAATFTSGSVMAVDDCVKVQVSDRFMLPDGSIHDAGRLSLCTHPSLSPVAGIHKLSVDGVPVGMVLSRAGVSEGPAPTTPIVLFHRGSSGVLDLIGFSLPEGRHGRTFLLRRPAPPPAMNVALQTVRAVEVAPPHTFGPVALTHAAD